MNFSGKRVISTNDYGDREFLVNVVDGKCAILLEDPHSISVAEVSLRDLVEIIELLAKACAAMERREESSEFTGT